MEQKTETGDITATCQVLLSITGKKGHHSEPITFYLADLGQEDLILGTDWLRLHNPDVNWQNRSDHSFLMSQNVFFKTHSRNQGISTQQASMEFTEEEEDDTEEEQWIPEGITCSKPRLLPN